MRMEAGHVNIWYVPIFVDTTTVVKGKFTLFLILFQSSEHQKTIIRVEAFLKRKKKITVPVLVIKYHPRQ